MWALRYRSTRAEDPTLLRLLVLSRNLTRDRSWDISLRLDGELMRRPDAKNRPLFDLLTRLPDLAVASIPDEARALTAEIAEDFRCTKWMLPDRFDDVTFALNGFGGKVWQPAPERLPDLAPPPPVLSCKRWPGCGRTTARRIALVCNHGSFMILGCLFTLS